MHTKLGYAAALAALLLIGPLRAHALVVTISGQGEADGAWNVTTVQGTYLDLADQLNAQVWAPSLDLAVVFARAAGDSFGTPNFGFLPTGPLFAHVWGGEGTNAAISAAAWFTPTPLFPTSGVGTVSWAASSDGTPVWAVASRAVSEPATAGLFALAFAGMAAIRRRRAAP